MEMIKGGFPPLVLINKKSSEEIKKGDLKSQFFADSVKKNVNIRELLSSNNNTLELKDSDNELKTVEDF